MTLFRIARMAGAARFNGTYRTPASPPRRRMVANRGGNMRLAATRQIQRLYNNIVLPDPTTDMDKDIGEAAASTLIRAQRSSRVRKMVPSTLMSSTHA